MKPEERIGQTIGIYTITGVVKAKKGSNKIYECQCNICGRKFIKQLILIKRAKECRHINCIGQERDFDTKWSVPRIGKTFRGMIERCYNPKDKSYCWYGEKGIGIYEEWVNHPKLFEKWALENGYGDSLTIDRIDSNKDYCPENCRWITREENSRRSTNHYSIDVCGEEHTGREWAIILGIGHNTINKYIKLYGMDDTKEFIRRFLENPELKNKAKRNESLFNLYMS